MLPNIDYRDLPRVAQRLMARSQTDEAMSLPRRSFLKLAGAGGLALGAFPHLVMAQAAGKGQVRSSRPNSRRPSCRSLPMPKSR